jgi:hypothetical protein
MGKVAILEEALLRTSRPHFPSFKAITELPIAVGNFIDLVYVIEACV